MYLLVYKGKCASTIINGIKFTQKNSTANIDDSRLHEFADDKGNSYYNDLVVVKIAKSDIVPEDPKEKNAPVDTIDTVETSEEEAFIGTVETSGTEENAEKIENKEPEKVTVEGLKKAHKLDELQAIAAELGLSTEGSKTELAVRIVAFKEGANSSDQE